MEAQNIRRKYSRSSNQLPKSFGLQKQSLESVKTFKMDGLATESVIKKSVGGPTSYFYSKKPDPAVSKTGVLFLPRTQARFSLQEYSITTQGIQQI